MIAVHLHPIVSLIFPMWRQKNWTCLHTVQQKFASAPLILKPIIIANPFLPIHDLHSHGLQSHDRYFARNHMAAERTYPKFIPSYRQSKAVFLQVGAFHNKNYALKLQRRLNSLVSASSRTSVKVMNPPYNERLYKVKIGPFRDVASLAKITHHLKSMGIIANKIYG